MPRKKKQVRHSPVRDTNEKRARRFLADHPELRGIAIFQGLHGENINISARRAMQIKRELRGKKRTPSVKPKDS